MCYIHILLDKESSTADADTADTADTISVVIPVVLVIFVAVAVLCCWYVHNK